MGDEVEIQIKALRKTHLTFRHCTSCI